MGAIEDIENIKWWQFRQAFDLLGLEFDGSVDTEQYYTVGGGCYPRQKVTGENWGFSGSLNMCKNDIAGCRLCRRGNCVAFCYAPCGMDLIHDYDGVNIDPDMPDDPIFGDPIGAGIPVRIGVALIQNCNESANPPDYIQQSFTAVGVGQELYFNFCSDLINFDEDLVPEGVVLAPSTQRVIVPGAASNDFVRTDRVIVSA